MNKLLLLPLVLLVSCASGGPRAGVKPPDLKPRATVYLTGKPEWKSISDVRADLGNNAVYSGNTVDLKNTMISGKKMEKPKNSQSEDAIPLRVRIKNFTLQNGIIDSIPGGIMVHEDSNTFKNITFIGTSEDFLSNPIDKAGGLSIINCRMYNNERGDKSLQLNNGENILIKDSYITGAQTGARIHSKESKKKTVSRIEGTTFESVTTAVNQSGSNTLYLKNNKYIDVKEKINTSPQSKIINQ